MAARTPGDKNPGTPRRDAKYGIVVARPFGIPVYLSPWWLAFAVLLVYVYANSLETGIAKVTDKYLVAAAFVVLLYVSVLIHELAHCVAARRFGLTVRRVLLYPLGGYSEIEEEPGTPGREALISGAGPVISLVLAGAGYLIDRSGVAAAGSLPEQLIAQLWFANLIVGVFNLLPGLPLDGGRIFRAGVWKLTGRPAAATVAASWAGRVMAMIIAGLAVFGLTNSAGGFLNFTGFWLLAIALFMWVQSTQAIRAARIRERLPSVSARALARRAIPVPAATPLSEAVRRAQEAGARALVIADHTGAPTAIVSEAAVLATPEERRPWVEAGSLARSLEPSLVLSADLSGADLIRAVQRIQASEYLLIEPSGQVFGVLAAADLNLAFAGV